MRIENTMMEERRSEKARCGFVKHSKKFYPEPDEARPFTYIKAKNLTLGAK
jgi:hypothetical protein